jgi:hypothetical protein
MIETARREDHSGADAAILHLDDLFPDQYAALVALLCDAAARTLVDGCEDCGGELGHGAARGLCRRCYDRHHKAGTLGRYATKRKVTRRWGEAGAA